ncbi:hypothetical protein [Paramagnetospirillum kuznetsovii]|uniref:hypothetical protein n=1 Tax=Paramagnetospirillum kuznetsovii TaxID=2053833 RepID=UPI001374CCEE|nr:hypothetical protein [Paramagnetospirillum kuznetsovii]
MNAHQEENAGRVKEIPVETFAAGVAKLITGCVSGVHGGHDAEGGGIFVAVGRDLGALLHKVEAGLMGGGKGK